MNVEWRYIMRGFGLDGKFFRGLTKAGDFLILGLITVIFCIPVITIGASLTAAFYAGMKLVKDEENYVFKDFWKSFKTNLSRDYWSNLSWELSDYFYSLI